MNSLLADLNAATHKWNTFTAVASRSRSPQTFSRSSHKPFAFTASRSRLPQAFHVHHKPLHIHRKPFTFTASLFASFRIHRQQCTRACKRMTLIESKGIIWKVIFHFKLSFNLAFPFKVLAADEWRRCSWN